MRCTWIVLCLCELGRDGEVEMVCVQTRLNVRQQQNIQQVVCSAKISAIRENTTSVQDSKDIAINRLKPDASSMRTITHFTGTMDDAHNRSLNTFISRP